MALRRTLLCLVGSEVLTAGAMIYGTRLDTVRTMWRYITEDVCLVLLNKEEHCKINNFFFCFLFSYHTFCNIQFHENPASGSQVFSWIQTQGTDTMQGYQHA
jgi:hypothetical protein